MASAEQTVTAAYPSARVERKGLTFVAIMARTREGGRLRDNLLGSGKTETEAWLQAAKRLAEAVEN